MKTNICNTIAKNCKGKSTQFKSYGYFGLQNQLVLDLARAIPHFRKIQTRTFHGSILCRTFSSKQKSTETFPYKAEVHRVMDMIVNSLYSNKDAFLREMISNASDALDKVRFVSIERPEVLFGKEELEIRIKTDDSSNTIIIEDDGIGMTREELSNNLGTIAQSGTVKFVDDLKERHKSGESNQIGQFGVGFYSAFLVASEVKVQTRHPDSDAQWVWESAIGSHQYKIYEDATTELVRGTRVTIKLKDQCKEFLDTVKLRGLIKLYSEFIGFPIKLWLADDVDTRVVDNEMTEKRQEFENSKANEEGRTSNKVEPAMKSEWKKEWKFVLINESKPLWQRDPKEVSTQEYNEFYKATFKEFLDPLALSHFGVEGMYEFKGLLFIPGLAPFDFNRDMQTNTKNIRLYVKKVFISDSFQHELVPSWLSFVKGVVDSNDLPLNVSREILQESRIVMTIQKQIVSRSIKMIKSLRDDTEKWKTFWESFGKNIKMGIVECSNNRDELASICQFLTSYTPTTLPSETKDVDGTTTLEAYVSRLKEGQKGIFYFATTNTKTASKAPFVEKLIKEGYEVIFITDPLDEYVVMNLATFKSAETGKEIDLIDLTRENVEESDPHANGIVEKDLEEICNIFKEVLKEKVEKVVVSSRLDSFPCVLVTSKFGWSANMERIMKAQAGADAKSYDYMRGRRSLEINPNNPLIRNVLKVVQNKGLDKAQDYINFIHQTALLNSGFELEDPLTFTKEVYDLLSNAMQEQVEPTAHTAQSVSPD